MTMNMANDMDDSVSGLASFHDGGQNHGHGHDHSEEEGHGLGPHGHGADHSHNQGENTLDDYQPGVPSQDVFADTGPGWEPSIDHHAPSREGVPAFFQTNSLEAVPVVSRSAESFNIRAAGFVAPYKIVGHRKGRRSVTLSCPTTVTSAAGATSTPLGFMVSDDRTFLDVFVGLQVNPGDSVKIESEAEVWVAPLPTATSGYCQYVETFDAPSGPQP
jgi:hypothetical protein